MTSISVLIVEDEPLIAEDLRHLLIQAGYEVTGVAYKAERALQMLEIRQPDMMLLDIQLGGEMSGIDLARQINTAHRIPFIFITSFSDEATVSQARETYPMGYLVKPFNEQSLYTTLEIALHNFTHFYAENKTELNADDINEKLPTPLTKREFDTLCLLRKGFTNPQIADQQYVSVNTVKTHLSNLFVKLGVESRTQAVLRIHSLLKAQRN